MNALEHCFLYGFIDLTYVRPEEVPTVTQQLVRGGVDVRQAAMELNCVLIGAQWSQLMGHTDHHPARLTILARLRALAAEEIPTRAFESVDAWRAYLKSRAE